jgi:hypothetical protein
MGRKLQVTMIFVIVVLGGLYAYTEYTGVPVREFFTSGAQTVRIKNLPMNVIVADTPELRQKGLSGRDEIGAQGMLFVFDKADYHGIWMKDMRFPIDVIWIGEDLKVISVTRNLSPDSYPQIFEPPRPARYAIETNRYFAETFGITTGDEVELLGGI